MASDSSTLVGFYVNFGECLVNEHSSGNQKKTTKSTSHLWFSWNKKYLLLNYRTIANKPIFYIFYLDIRVKLVNSYPKSMKLLWCAKNASNITIEVALLEILMEVVRLTIKQWRFEKLSIKWE